MFKEIKIAVFHELKTDPIVFQESWDQKKMYEIRLNDRLFKLNEILILRETEYTGEEMASQGLKLRFTGRQLTRRIICITKGYGLQEGWCILGLEVI